MAKALYVLASTAILILVTAGVSAAATPEFEATLPGENPTYSGKSVSGTTPTVKATVLGVEGTITCGEIVSIGLLHDKSSITTQNVVEFKKNCLQTIGSTKTACAEPIKTKELLGTLGYVKKEEKALSAFS